MPNSVLFLPCAHNGKKFKMDILIQTIGIIGAIFAFLAYQFNKHKTIMLFKTLSEVSFAIQFTLLGAYTGLAMNIIGCTRNFTFAYLVSRKKNTAPFIVLFAVIALIIGIITWESAISLFAISGKIITTIAFGMKKPQTVRFFALPASLCWIIYDILYFSIGGIITELFTVISIAIGTWRYYVSNKNDKEVS